MSELAYLITKLIICKLFTNSYKVCYKDLFFPNQVTHVTLLRFKNFESKQRLYIYILKLYLFIQNVPLSLNFRSQKKCTSMVHWRITHGDLCIDTIRLL